MNKIEIRRSTKAFKQRTVFTVCLIPPDLRRLQALVEFHHLCIENVKTRSISLFAVCTHKLHAKANTQNRLLKIFQNKIESAFTQIFHRGTGFTHTRKDPFISFLYQP